MDFDVKENNFEKSYMPEGKFIGLITQIETEKKNEHYSVIISVTIWDGQNFDTFKKRIQKDFHKRKSSFSAVL